MKNEKVGLKGFVEMKVFDKNGKLKTERKITNTIMNSGKASVAGLILSDVSVNDFDYLAIGTSSTAPASSQTALGAEAYRTSGTGTRVTTTVTNDTAQLSGSFAITASANIAESGIFDASSGGVMLARTTFSSIPVEDGDTINTIWKIQVS